MGKYLSEYGSRPNMLLAYTDAAYASRCGRHFRRLGWEVLIVANAFEARELADETRPDVVVVDIALLEQGGWSVTVEKPGPRVVLVVNRRTTDIDVHRQAIGADDAVRREDGPQALADAVFGPVRYAEAV